MGYVNSTARPRIIDSHNADRRNLCYFCTRTAAVHLVIEDKGAALTFNVCARHSDLNAPKIIAEFENRERIKCKVG
jgi:hypothetical protein